MLASPSDDQTIRIWNASTARLVHTIRYRSDWIDSVAWSPDGKRLAAGFGNGSVRIYKLSFPARGSRKHTTVWTDKRHSEEVTQIVWSPDGARIASGSKDGNVYVFDALNGDLVATPIAAFGWVNCLAWSRTFNVLAAGAGDGSIGLWHGRSETRFRVSAHSNAVVGVAWSPTEPLLASGSYDGTVAIWRIEDSDDIERALIQKKQVLEGHTGHVFSVCFSHDGRLLASRSTDGTVRLWNVLDGEYILSLESPFREHVYNNVAFNPVQPTLCSLIEEDRAIQLWELDFDLLLDTVPVEKKTHYTSAKIVLVGESNAGKSCLAMRLAEDRYPEDHEHGTTHGMRFWPMEAEDLHRSAKPPQGQRRDVVLWDFGGQDEHQLVHQMFLHDTTLALVLIDPTRGRAAMDEARDWNKRLEKHLGGRQAVKLLVGAKQDRRRSDLIHDTAIKALCQECGFAAFIDVSARTKRKIPTLRKAIADALDWDHLAKTSRPELFQRIRDDIEERRKRGEVVSFLDELHHKFATKKLLGTGPSSGRRYKKDGRFRGKRRTREWREAAVNSVSDQLATQGVIVRTKLTGGDEALVLQLPVIERYAGSLIVAARNNPRGVPVLEERLLGSTRDIPLPGMTKKERLKGEKERIVLECIVELMIQHGLCFRHGGLLVFPTLFPSGDGDGEKLPHSVSLYYDFTGAIDNIYASLVARLMVSEEFGEGRLWAGRVEFDRPGEGICGLRQIKRTGGLAHVDLFFAEDTSPDRRDLFTRFVEEHLRRNGVEIKEHEAIKCTCGEVIEERIVQANIKRGEEDVVCPVCRARTLIGEGVERIRQRDPESDHKILALRTTIEKQTARDVEIAKSRVSGNGHERRPDEPIRVLHLSDLHFTGDTSPQTHLVPLLQDIRKGDFLGFDTVEYLVISGDMTDRGCDEGLDNAREFVELLIDELGLSAHRCILVPGNHDVQDLEEAHRWFGTDARARSYQRDESRWHREGTAIFIPDQDSYPKRLKRFSDAFFHKVLPAQPYPLEPAEQGQSYLFDDTQIQFLALNSAWQIDQFNRKRSGLHPDAVSGAIAEADKQIADAVQRRDMKKAQKVLRFCVWHHSIQHAETMQSTDAVELLQAAGVRLCLHGWR